VSCAGVCQPHEITCSRPPPGDYEHELCAKLAARGECHRRPTSFLAQCFRACSMADPEKVHAAIMDEIEATMPFPQEPPLGEAARLGEAVEIQIAGHAVNATRRHSSPAVVELHQLVSRDEAQSILQLAKPLLSASPTGANDKGYGATLRTSSSAVLLEANQHTAVRAVRDRVANLTGYPEPNLEPLQLVRYLPGQQYEPHHDFFDACDVREVFRGGERRATVLIYLNAIPDDGGGGTHFPELAVRVQPRRDGGVFFENYVEVNPHRGDARSLHQGEPPTRTTKFAVNVWIRARSFRL
jgi:prolyl 4-hydroxylase